MSDWAVGDLARAVGVKREDFPGGYFAEGVTANGKIYRVASVNSLGGIVGLRFDDLPSPAPHGHWHSASFRKIYPDKHEQCEPEFITLLKRSKVTASDWLIRVGPIAKRLNEESRHDGDGA